jgi:hypothetical protein
MRRADGMAGIERQWIRTLFERLRTDNGVVLAVLLIQSAVLLGLCLVVASK